MEAGPTLLVDVPPDRRAEREYVLSVLLGEWLRIPYVVRVTDGLAETRLSLRGTEGPVVTCPDVLFGSSTGWMRPESLPVVGPARPLDAWTGRTVSVPLLYPTAGANDPVTRDGDRIVLGWDLLGSLFFMLARYEEHVLQDRDEHGRFPSAAGMLTRSGWHQWPLADIYLHVFAATLNLAWPALRLAPDPSGGLAVGHDVDHPSSSMRWHGSERLRVVAGDVLRRRDPDLALRRAGAFLPWSPPLTAGDPFSSFDTLMRASERVGLASTFYFLTADTAAPFGSSYRVSDHWARRLLEEIAGRGHWIGLHGSYGSHVDPRKLAGEWSLLEAACAGIESQLRRTVRQHYLRWAPGATWAAQAAAGLAEDETLGFSDTIGYRAGTARSFPAFDLPTGRVLPLRVRPLHAMDAALARMPGSEEEVLVRLVELRRRTSVYGGTFSVLWHNSSLETNAARRRYEVLVRDLAS